MKYLKYITLGMFFGLVAVKSEIISWYRIQEMFRFDSFHMYGIIGSAVIIGILIIQFIKRTRMKDIKGQEINLPPKKFSIWRYLLGGTIFGMGWAITGACPGPSFALVGYGLLPYLVAIFFGILGTFVYGKLQSRLPH